MSRDARILALLAGLGSAALLGGAYVFQMLGYAPCELCLLQRWPHALAILLGLFVWQTGRRPLAWAGALAALATAGLGVYHTGVERGFWIGPSTCSSGGIQGLSPGDLMTQIMNAPLVRCNEVAWSLFGLSMASWNALLSLGLALLWVAAARRR
ncbi:MAG: disulfide bond formation protein B [Proteobacteria bacterium]|nr:disulfide bond formation protein B [Pseudomonadota bacterium]MBS0574072.1 disulfide bond formation protein B [Pseudomonadota bacterium]